MSVRFMLNETSYFGKGAREELAPEKYRQKFAKPVRITQFDERPVYLTRCINNEFIKVEKQ